MPKLLRLILAPIEVFRTGRFMGVEVERNPIAWIPFVLATLVTLPFMVVLFLLVLVVSPIYGLISMIGFRQFSAECNRARYLEQSIEIYNEKGTEERSIPWQRVTKANLGFSPPFFHPELVLDDGEEVPIFSVDYAELIAELEKREIPCDRSLLSAARERASD